MPNEEWNKFAEDVKERLAALQAHVDESLALQRNALSEQAAKINQIIDYLDAIKPQHITVVDMPASDRDDMLEFDDESGSMDDLRGVGDIIVHSVPGGKIIGRTGDDATGAAVGGLDAKQIKYGKLKTAWSSGNTVTLNPCSDTDGSNPDTSREIVCYIRMPSGAADVKGFDADVADVLSYWPLTSTTGILLANPSLHLPADGADLFVLQKDSATSYDVKWDEVHATPDP